MLLIAFQISTLFSPIVQIKFPWWLRYFFQVIPYFFSFQVSSSIPLFLTGNSSFSFFFTVLRFLFFCGSVTQAVFSKATGSRQHKSLYIGQWADPLHRIPPFCNETSGEFNLGCKALRKTFTQLATPGDRTYDPRCTSSRLYRLSYQEACPSGLCQ